jgi:putative hemolysin
MEPTSELSSCLSLLAVDAGTWCAQAPVIQARQAQACKLPEYTQQQVSTTGQLEAEAQHTFERLIVGRSVFRKSWRLGVMRELFKIKDELLNAQVRSKLITFLKETHYS